MRRFRALWSVSLLLLFAAPLLAQNPSWEGKTILVKRTGIDIGHVDAKGKDVVTDTIDEISYKVLNEEDGWIRIKTARGKYGWFLRDDAVLLEDAPAYFTKKIQQNPKNAKAYQSRATALTLKGDLDGAAADLKAAIKLKPLDAFLYNSLGIIASRKKDYDQAIANYTKSIAFNAKQPFAFNNRGTALFDKKEYEPAIADFNQAIQLDPSYASAYLHRGMAQEAKQDYAKAIADYGEANRLDANALPPYNGLAWLLATCPQDKLRDGKKALALAKKACELTDWKEPLYLDTLAAAYAETGQYTEAVKYQEMALKDPAFAKSHGKEAQFRLEVYMAGEPYRLGMEKKNK